MRWCRLSLSYKRLCSNGCSRTRIFIYIYVWSQQHFAPLCFSTCNTTINTTRKCILPMARVLSAVDRDRQLRNWVMASSWPIDDDDIKCAIIHTLDKTHITRTHAHRTYYLRERKTPFFCFFLKENNTPEVHSFLWSKYFFFVCSQNKGSCRLLL